MKKNLFLGGCYLGNKLKCKQMLKIWFGPFWAKERAKKGQKGAKKPKNVQGSRNFASG